MDLIMSSLTLQPNLFQLFQPIGGVSATPLSQARVASGNVERKMRTTTDKTIFRLNGNLPMAASRRIPRRIIPDLCGRELVDRSAVRGGLFLGGAVQDHAHFFERHKAAADHFIEPRQDGFNFFGRFNHFHNNRQILRQAKNFVGVVCARSAVAANTPQNGCTGKSLAPQQFYNRFVQRLAVPFVRFADVNSHQRAFAFKLFVRHGALPRTLKPVGQADSRDRKEQACNYARADVSRSAQPFTLFEHFCGFPAETRKGGVAAKKSDGDRDAPVRRNNHAIQRELPDETKQKTSGEIDEQRSIWKRAAHANLHDSLQAVPRERAGGAEQRNKENLHTFTSQMLRTRRSCSGRLPRRAARTLAGTKNSWRRPAAR